MLIPSSRRHRTGPAASAEAQDAPPEILGDGLKRDMAYKRIVSFEAPIGGAAKRAFDLVFALLSAPFWISAVIILFLRRKNTRPRRLVSEACIGYGGRPFKRLSFVDKETEIDLIGVAPLNLLGQDLGTLQSPPRRNGFFEGLPGMLNVLLGQASLIGPKPLARAEFDALRGRRKNYASARPGLIDAFEGLSAAETRCSPYGNFSIHWKTATDFAIAGRAFARLRARLRNQALEKRNARQ